MEGGGRASLEGGEEMGGGDRQRGVGVISAGGGGDRHCGGGGDQSRGGRSAAWGVEMGRGRRKGTATAMGGRRLLDESEEIT